MATMYSLFFSLLFTAVCSDNGDDSGVLSASMPAHGLFILLDQNEAKTGTKWSSDNSLRLAQPRPMTSISVTSISIMERSKSFMSKLTNYVGRPIRLHFVPLKVTGGVRDQVINIASNELGVREATGNNDGLRVEEYLRYTNLGKGYEWCAAFASWVYGQAGFSAPRNPWSPALFPKARVYWKQSKFADLHIRDFIAKADIFGIYGASVRRINHVGLVKEKQSPYLLTIEGNSNNRVESRRRHLRTIYAIADWVD